MATVFGGLAMFLKSTVIACDAAALSWTCCMKCNKKSVKMCAFSDPSKY